VRVEKAANTVRDAKDVASLAADDARSAISTRRSEPVRIEVTPRTMLYAVIAAALTWLLIQLFPVVLAIVIGLFLAGTLNPIVEALESRGIRRGYAIGIVFTLTVLIAAALVAVTVPSLIAQVGQAIDKAPEFRSAVIDRVSHWPVVGVLVASARNLRYEDAIKALATGAFAYSGRVAEISAYAASSIFLALYMLIDRDRLRGALFALVARTQHVRLARILINLETIVGGYIRGQVITSALFAVFTFVLLTACGVKSAIALAVLAGLADALPYVGVFLSVVPAVLASLLQSPVTALVVLACMLAYEELESRFLVPRIYGRVLRLPSTIVLVALLAGGTLMGILGALLALPIAAAIRMLIEELQLELPGETPPDPSLLEQDAAADASYERAAVGLPAVQASVVAVQIAGETVEQNDDSNHPSRESSHH
jgi:predicted PurR-regulated permease PerM